MTTFPTLSDSNCETGIPNTTNVTIAQKIMNFFEGLFVFAYFNGYAFSGGC